MPATDTRAARTHRALATSLIASVLVLATLDPLAGQAQERVDYLTFAHGAIPVSIGGAGATKGAAMEHAVETIDGNPGGFPIVNRADAETDVVFVYALPAATTFDRFAVPNVLETPSPSQTFFRRIEIDGATDGPEGPWSRLAAGTLDTHPSRGQVTEVPLSASVPVRWVRLRLSGGIQMLRDQMFLEFSEIIGNGSQETVAMVDHFAGSWQGRGVRLDLAQEGPVVVGCYDTGGDLRGTVSGNLLRATGVDRSTRVPSAFILSVVDGGVIRGVRSTNGAPFRLYEGPRAAAGPVAGCTAPPQPTLGCGSVVHGVTFDFDSATLRAESEPVLTELFSGLQAETSASVGIEGHTSSEGAEAYNQELSQRRAQAVVDDLVRRGLPTSRLTAVGVGEARPIASNDDETGRSLNRRVEIVCR